MQKSEVLTLLMLMASYDGRDPDQVAVESWHRIIGSFGYDVVEQAVLAYYSESRYRMMPCDIVERVERMSRDASLDAATRALEARQRLELLGYLDDEFHDAPTTVIRAELREYSAPQEEVEAVWNVLRRHIRERKELESAHSAEIRGAFAQTLAPGAPTLITQSL